MSDLTPEALQNLRTLAEAATKPWGLAICEGGAATSLPPCGIWLAHHGPRTITHDRMTLLDYADARYIAAVSPDVVLALLDQIDAASNRAYCVWCGEERLTEGAAAERRKVGRELDTLARGLADADPTGRLGGALVASALSDIGSRLMAGMPVEDATVITVEVTP